MGGFLLFSTFTFSQTIVFGYDEAGNRISSYLVSEELKTTPTTRTRLSEAVTSMPTPPH